MKKQKKQKVDMEISVQSIGGEPETSFDLIRKYGTYEIQPTADTTNLFPTIAQGFPDEGMPSETDGNPHAEERK